MRLVEDPAAMLDAVLLSVHTHMLLIFVGWLALFIVALIRFRRGANPNARQQGVRGAWPALAKFGLGFVTSESWNPVTENFGARAPIYGTLVTSAIAMVIGIPISFGIAVFITELCPPWLKRPIGTAIELLAGIPSIIYGIWGLFVFAPFLQKYVQPGLIDTFENVPLLSTLFEGPPYGIGMLTAGFILAIMVLPFVTAISRDVFDAVPPVLKEAAYGLGCTTWEVVRYVVLPYTRVGVIGGVMLGLGRALHRARRLRRVSH